MKIKEIKIVSQDQSTEIADIGADAINVDYNDTNVKAELDKLNVNNNMKKNNITNLQNGLNITNSNLALQTSRIDNIATLEEGSTTGDAELIDGRVTFNGYNKQNIGTAIRKSNTDIYNYLQQYNIKDTSNCIELDLNLEQGAISSYTYQELDNYTNRVRTGFLNVNEFSMLQLIVPLNEFSIYTFLYDGDFNVISHSESWSPSSTKQFTLYNNVKNIRIVFRNKDDENLNITPADLSNIKIIGYKENSPFSVNYRKTVETNASFAEQLFPGDITNINFLNKNKLQAYLVQGNNFGNDIPIELQDNNVYVLLISNFITGRRVNPYTLQCTQYIQNNTKNKIWYRVITYTASTDTVTISRDWTVLTDYNTLDARITTLENTESGSPQNKWYVLGDSISAGYWSCLQSDLPSGVTPQINYDDGTCCVWDRNQTYTYWTLINNWYLKRQLVNLAVPGQGYLKVAGFTNTNGKQVIDNNNFDDASLITIAWGFNDWHYDMERGTHNDAEGAATINGTIRYCLKTLVNKAPNARIVVQLPMNGWRYGGTMETNWGLGYALDHSDTLEDVSNDIKYWCDYYGIEYIDLTHNNSIVNRLNIKTTLIDGSHPSKIAHQQLARAVWSKLGNN